MKQVSKNISLVILFFIAFTCVNSKTLNDKNKKETCVLDSALKNNCCTSPSTLDITGSGEISLPANTIIIGVGVSTTDKRSSGALKQNNSKVNQVLQCFTKNAISTSNTSTTNFSIRPNYNYSTNSYDGYVVEQNIEVRTNDLTTAGNVIDCVGDAQALVNYVNFDVDPAAKLSNRTALINAAVDDAMDKAKPAANKLGYKVNGVKSVNILDNGGSPVLYMLKSADSASTSTNLVGNNQTLRISLAIVFYVSPLTS